MELEIIKNEKNYLEFAIKGERYTFPNLLKSRLLDDQSVTFVSNKLEHLLLDRTHFVLATQGKPAKKVLEESLKKIEKDLDSFEQGITKALK